MKNIQSQHWSLKRKIMFPKKTKQKTKTNEKKEKQKKAKIRQIEHCCGKPP